MAPIRGTRGLRASQGAARWRAARRPRHSGTTLSWLAAYLRISGTPLPTLRASGRFGVGEGAGATWEVVVGSAPVVD